MYFVSQDNSSVNYSKECLGELVRQKLENEGSITYLENGMVKDITKNLENFIVGKPKRITKCLKLKRGLYWEIIETKC